MSGFTKINVGTVEIEHFSTASLIKVTFKQMLQKDQAGNMTEIINEKWFDYTEFSDLKKACNLTDDWL